MRILKSSIFYRLKGETKTCNGTTDYGMCWKEGNVTFSYLTRHFNRANVWKNQKIRLLVRHTDRAHRNSKNSTYLVFTFIWDDGYHRNTPQCLSITPKLIFFVWQLNPRNNKILWTVKTDILNIKYNEPFGTLLEYQQSETFIESKIKCKHVAYKIYYTKNLYLSLFFIKNGTRWWIWTADLDLIRIPLLTTELIEQNWLSHPLCHEEPVGLEPTVLLGLTL